MQQRNFRIGDYLRPVNINFRGNSGKSRNNAGVHAHRSTATFPWHTIVPRYTVNTLYKLTIIKYVVISNLSARLARFLQYVVQGGEYTGA